MYLGSANLRRGRLAHGRSVPMELGNGTLQPFAYGFSISRELENSKSSKHEDKHMGDL